MYEGESERDREEGRKETEIYRKEGMKDKKIGMKKCEEQMKEEKNTPMFPWECRTGLPQGSGNLF